MNWMRAQRHDYLIQLLNEQVRHEGEVLGTRQRDQVRSDFRPHPLLQLLQRFHAHALHAVLQIALPSCAHVILPRQLHHPVERFLALAEDLLLLRRHEGELRLVTHATKSQRIDGTGSEERLGNGEGGAVESSGDGFVEARRELDEKRELEERLEDGSLHMSSSHRSNRQDGNRAPNQRERLHGELEDVVRLDEVREEDCE